MQVKCTEVQAQALLVARRYNHHDRKTAKRLVFAEIRRDNPSLRVGKFVLFIENPANELYRVLRDKRTKLPVDDGRPEPVIAFAPGLEAIVKKVAAKKPAVKVAAKKAPAVKVAAKKPAVKVAAKKAPAVKPKAAAKAPTRSAKVLARPSKPKASAAPKKAKK